MQPFTRITGAAVPMLDDDLNTDQMAPIQMSRELKPDYADLLFKRQRVNPDGSLVAGHILNRPQYKTPAIFVGGRNFGCGSSREAAVWCLMAVGVRCVVARSLADIFRENCLQNGVLPIELTDKEADAFEARVLAADGRELFTVDLITRTISGPNSGAAGGGDISFQISDSDRTRLMEGLDDIGYTMKHLAEIETWERGTAKARPWAQSMRDKRQV